RFCDCDCAFAELRNFKNAHWSVPQNRFSLGDFLLIKRNRCRADIDCPPSVRDSMLGRETAGVSHVCAGANFIRFHDVDWEQKLYSAFLRQIEKFAREIDLVGFDPARADWNSLRFQ